MMKEFLRRLFIKAITVVIPSVIATGVMMYIFTTVLR